MRAHILILFTTASVFALSSAAHSANVMPMPKQKPTRTFIETFKMSPIYGDEELPKNDLAVTRASSFTDSSAVSVDPIASSTLSAQPLAVEPLVYETITAVPTVTTQQPAYVLQPTATETLVYETVATPLQPATTVYTASTPLIPASTSFGNSTVISHAQDEPEQPSILHLSNDKLKLHELVLRPDITTAINYRGSERITTVLMGRAEDFFVDTPKNHQTISIRPKSSRSRSNLTVVTSKDIHHYNLTAVDESSNVKPVYGVVVESDSEAKRGKSKKKKKKGADVNLGELSDLNFSYTYRASDELRPLRLFDDGEHTYFQFPDHIATPAIFAVDENGKEQIVNHHVKGNYVVVESLGKQFTLRRGSVFTCIYNKAFPKAKYGSDAPTREGGAA